MKEWYSGNTFIQDGIVQDRIIFQIDNHSRRTTFQTRIHFWVIQCKEKTHHSGLSHTLSLQQIGTYELGHSTEPSKIVAQSISSIQLRCKLKQRPMSLINTKII